MPYHLSSTVPDNINTQSSYHHVPAGCSIETPATIPLVCTVKGCEYLQPFRRMCDLKLVPSFLIISHV